MKREDVIQVDALKTELSSAFRQFEQRLTAVVGELIYAVDTVVDRYNDLDSKQAATQRQLDVVTGQLNTVSDRLLALERIRGEH